MSPKNGNAGLKIISVICTSKLFWETELIYPGVALYFEADVFQFDESIEDWSKLILSKRFPVTAAP
ncbi:MAG: hypothetical protein MZV64_32020 [Ignavibacteriales bacterium]|nr:hypothetical protein [Ignavibacteriales bacterium]